MPRIRLGASFDEVFQFDPGRIVTYRRGFKARSRGRRVATVKLDSAKKMNPIPPEEQRRHHQERHFPIFRKNSAIPGGTSPVQKRPAQKIKSLQFKTSSTVQTRSPGA
ncbi:hypothetical protein TNCV_1683981 [Trichonephila clavipes]|nr:hypothetical protein TNCV_1683981 [Trichonephila clavipes]